MEPGKRLAPLFHRPARARALAWGRAPLAFAPSRALRRLIAAAEVDGWLDCSLLHHPFFSMVRGGKPLLLSQVSSSRTVAGQTAPGCIDGKKVRRWMERGATLMVGNLHEWHAPSQRFCRTLAGGSSWKVGAAVFWTAAGSRGLRPHFDDAHVFVAQIAGAKRWSLYDRRRGVESVVELRPGDGLYVPEGFVHGTEALAEASLHVSVTFRPA
jgi:uncharacterized RmlC-like cupin family protein